MLARGCGFSMELVVDGWALVTKIVPHYPLFSRSVSSFPLFNSGIEQAGSSQQLAPASASSTQTSLVVAVFVVAVAPSPADWSLSSYRPGLRDFLVPQRACQHTSGSVNFVSSDGAKPHS